INDFLNPEDENIIKKDELTNKEILEIVCSLETETDIIKNEDDSSELPMISI
ncbi:4626_t:CDS:1, partial [Acaulospora morrowiae]